jgi:putative transposase
MNTVRIYRLTHLSPTLFRRMKEAQMEAARVWNKCCEIHLTARREHTRWPERDELQKATKGQFALYAQSVQMVVHAFLANIETTQKRRQTNKKIKYPYKTKRFYRSSGRRRQ